MKFNFFIYYYYFRRAFFVGKGSKLNDLADGLKVFLFLGSDFFSGFESLVSFV